MEKLERKGFELSVQSIKDNLDDVAGIRVICSFVDDIPELISYKSLNLYLVSLLIFYLL